MLQATQRTTLGDLEEGETVYLRKEYLEAVQRGTFDRQSSSTVHYEFLRPATRKELKTGEVKDFVREKVGQDGNIYIAKESEPSAHFFRTNGAFEGDFIGMWRDPLLVLPLGIEPVSPAELALQPLTIQEKSNQHLVLEGQGEQYVFYVGYPEIEFVFLDQAQQEALEDKKMLANALVGQAFLLENHPSLRFRSSPQADAKPAQPNESSMSILVKDVVVSHDQVLLVSEENGSNMVILDEASHFVMYDLSCIQQMRRDLLQRAQEGEEAEQVNRQLNALARKLTQGLDQREDWEALGLEERFFPLLTGGPSGPQYEYLLLPDPSEERLNPFLSVQISHAGAYWLHSHFASQNGLYHTRIYVYFANGDSLVSSRVSSLSPNHQREYQGDWVIEDIQFKGATDQEIVQRIAVAGDAPIRVRFSAGGTYFEEMTLPASYQRAIRDSWLYAKWLQQQETAMSAPGQY
ncbi:MAG: hypothetical protein AAF399_13105 [Bacteroidota bacterium]